MPPYKIKDNYGHVVYIIIFIYIGDELYCKNLIDEETLNMDAI